MADSERARDHLANERTFLAWVRTALGIIILGFAVGRFSLALRQLALLQDGELQTTGIAEWLGGGAILAGVGIILASYRRYQTVQRNLDGGRYEHSPGLVIAIGAGGTLIGLALIAYLVLTEHAIS